MKDLFQLLGLGAPFAAGAAIYALFNFLDKKASVAANRAIVEWMQGENYKQLDLATAVISAFDHLYGTPLLRLKTFMRSAFLSTCAVLIYFLFYVGRDAENSSVLVGAFVVFTIPVIATDYVSLFFVRKFLRVAKGNAKLSIISAFACAILTISALGLAFLAMFFTSWQISSIKIAAILTFPAWLVHLWLPLFLEGAAINSGIYAFLRTVRFAQWFIKRGDSHPFEAIGMTAGAVTFVGAAIFQGFNYWLS